MDAVLALPDVCSALTAAQVERHWRALQVRGVLDASDTL